MVTASGGMILVTGATGTIGSETIRLLGARGVATRALVRAGARAAALPQGIERVVGDLAERASLDAALDGVECVLLVPPRDPRIAELENNLVVAAVAGGVRHVARISVVGADPASRFELQRIHAAGERALEASGLAWTHLRPNSFLQNLLLFAGPISASGTFAFCNGRAPMARIDARDVADTAAVVLTSPGHEGRVYDLTGPETLSMEDVATRLSAVLGRTIAYVDLANDELEAEMVAAGWPPWAARLTVEAYGHELTGSAVVHDTVERVTGRRPRSFEDFARDFAAVFSSPPPSSPAASASQRVPAWVG